MPQRIQRSRKKGWKLPENTVSVSRPSKWSNPYKIGSDLCLLPLVVLNRLKLTEDEQEGGKVTRKIALEAYRIYLTCSAWGKIVLEDAQKHLRGKDLACFCKVGEQCHGDILIELCNE